MGPTQISSENGMSNLIGLNWWNNYNVKDDL